jgi:cullin-associated NEDD8-dissociated protein 1
MASTNLQPPSVHNVLLLLSKLQEQDPDLRYMALNDLSAILAQATPSLFTGDYAAAARTVDSLIRALQDSNGEVQNMAVKCVEPFVNKVPENVVCAFIEKVSQLPSDNIVDTAVPALALRSIVVSLPHPSPGVPRSKQVYMSYNAISRALIPRLTGAPPLNRAGVTTLPKPPPGMIHLDIQNGTDSNAIDVLIEVASSFGPMLHEMEVSSMIKISLEVLKHNRTSLILKKKSVTAISHLFKYLSTQALQVFMAQVNEELKKATLPATSRKLYFNLLASVSQSSPQKFAPSLKAFAPYAIAVLSQEAIERDQALMEETEERDPEADEVREAALFAVECWLSVCSKAMEPFTNEVIEIIGRFLQYDPNLAHLGDLSDIDEEFETLEGDDFEEDVGGDDEDDSSWKVRRSAAKVSQALIGTRSDGDLLEDGTLYSQVAPALVSRFKEREETVRLEILSALSTLIRITGGEKSSSVGQADDATPKNGIIEPPSRKRRRAGSDASMVDYYTSASSAGNHPMNDSAVLSSRAFTYLEHMSPDIVNGLSELMNTSHLPTKQASIGVLKDLVLALHGRLADYLSKTMATIIDAISNSKSSAATIGSSLTAANAYRVEALQCLGAIAEVQSSKDLAAYLAQITPVVKAALNESYSKVAVAALSTCEHLIDALTPPRSTSRDSQHALHELNSALIQLILANETDLEVRRLAIHSLGLLLGRSALGQNLIPAKDRATAMDVLLRRLRNETTRLTAARAIEAVAVYARNASDYPKEWVSSVASELVQQFRKSSRSLRGSSLAAMKTIAINPASRSQFSRAHIDRIILELLPLIKGTDFQSLTPALHILASFVEKDSTNNNLSQFVEPLGQLLLASMPSTTMKAYLTVIRAYGSHGIGKPLMVMLLQRVGLIAPPETVGKVIGTLLVSGQGSVGVTMHDFTKELGFPDEKRKCLALGVLGEYACLMGSASTLTPEFFMEKFTGDDEQTGQAAASALGRAGAGNISVYLPVILSKINQKSTGTKDKQLLLLSIREIVNADDHSELAPFVQELWNQVMAASQHQSNRTIGADCIGRLAIVDPGSFFPQLRDLLTPRTSTALRSLGLSALRVTVTSDSAAAHTSAVTNALKLMLQAVLKIIPEEDDLVNRRVSLTIVNAAMHSRFEDVVVPMLNDVIAVILQETKIRPELIKEVTMGPFKHKVDDGLECRTVSGGFIYCRSYDS